MKERVISEMEDGRTVWNVQYKGWFFWRTYGYWYDWHNDTIDFTFRTRVEAEDFMINGYDSRLSS